MCHLTKKLKSVVFLFFKQEISYNSESFLIMENLISDVFDVSDTFNKFFVYVLYNLNIYSEEILDEIVYLALKVIDIFKWL